MLASHRKKLDAKPDFYLLLGCRSHYNVELLNIGVSGTNVTTPTAFDLSILRRCYYGQWNHSYVSGAASIRSISSEST